MKEQQKQEQEYIQASDATTSGGKVKELGLQTLITLNQE